MNKKFWKKTGAMILAAAVALESSGAMVHGEINLKDFGTAEKQFSASSDISMATTGDLIALDDVGISVYVPDYTLIYQEDGFVYVFPDEADNFPYVIIGRYNFTADDFADQFTEYMQGSYADLIVAEPASNVMIDGKNFTRIVYNYSVNGYTTKDVRLFSAIGNFTYMFGSKNTEALGYVLEPGYQEQIAGSFALLAGGDSDYEKHVDSERSVSGSQIGDLGNVQTPNDDTNSNGDSGLGGTVGSGGSVGGAGRRDSQNDQQSGSIVFTEDSVAYQGTWVEFADGFKLYLPSHWREVVMTDEYLDVGTLYGAGDDTGIANAPYVFVNWTDEYSDMAAATQDLSDSGFRVDGAANINGIDCMTFSYMDDTNDLSGIMFFGPLDNSLLFTVIGAPYSKNVDTIAGLLCSLSPLN